MLTTIKGVCSNGTIVLEQTPATDKPIEVFVTFTGEIVEKKKPTDRIFGIGKGIVTYISPDFNEQLEDFKGYV
jgi:hypothetical protein